MHRTPATPGTGSRPVVAATGWLVRLALVAGCFLLSWYAVSTIVGPGSGGEGPAGTDPSLPWMAVWFLGALVLHDLVLFPFYAGGDRLLVLALRALPATRVPLVNHVRVPLLGSGLALLMFAPGILRQGGATTLTAAGLDQEPYRERWVWLTVALCAASALVWLARTLAGRAARAGR